MSVPGLYQPNGSGFRVSSFLEVNSLALATSLGFRMEDVRIMFEAATNCHSVLVGCPKKPLTKEEEVLCPNIPLVLIFNQRVIIPAAQQIGNQLVLAAMLWSEIARAFRLHQIHSTGVDVRQLLPSVLLDRFGFEKQGKEFVSRYRQASWTEETARIEADTTFIAVYVANYVIRSTYDGKPLEFSVLAKVIRDTNRTNWKRLMS